MHFYKVFTYIFTSIHIFKLKFEGLEKDNFLFFKKPRCYLKYILRIDKICLKKIKSKCRCVEKLQSLADRNYLISL